jgi:hypothetical protein
MRNEIYRKLKKVIKKFLDEHDTDHNLVLVRECPGLLIIIDRLNINEGY